MTCLVDWDRLLSMDMAAKSPKEEALSFFRHLGLWLAWEDVRMLLKEVKGNHARLVSDYLGLQLKQAHQCLNSIRKDRKWINFSHQLNQDLDEVIYLSNGRTIPYTCYKCHTGLLHSLLTSSSTWFLRLLGLLLCSPEKSFNHSYDLRA